MKKNKQKKGGILGKIKYYLKGEYAVNMVHADNLAIAVNSKLVKYRNIYSNRDIYIVGGGPTAKRFNFSDVQERSVFIGINAAYKDDRFTFDYLFVQDHMKEGLKDFFNYRETLCTKMVAIIPYNIYYQIHEADIPDADYIERYVLAFRKMQEIPKNISVSPFADLMGTAFSAVQFALYTNPRHIYLIGFDCGSGNIYHNDDTSNYDYQINSWHRIKGYEEELGRDGCIVSVNPVGLKGLFKDIYTK